MPALIAPLEPMMNTSAVKDIKASPASWESEALQAYAAGDDSAIDRIVEQYQGLAFWVARNLVRNDEVATDIAQDAFVKLIRNYQQFDQNARSSPGSCKLYAICPSTFYVATK